MTSSTPTATLDSALLAPTASIDSWRSAFGRAWRIYLPVRLVLSLCGALTMLFTQGMPAERSLRAWLSWLLLEPWNRMDVPWYLKIADGGYAIADGRASFHPLLPLLTRLLGTLLGGNTLLAGLLVANLACLGFLAALFRYVALDHGELVAGEALRWALYLPVGFVLLIPYTEPLLLCFTLLALWAARHERWFAAGAWACLAALTKQPGAALVAPLLWEAAARYRWGLLSWRGLRVVACLGLGPLGYLGFSFYRATMLGEVGGATVGELLRSLLISPQLSTGWGTRFGWPWEWLAYVATTPPKFIQSSMIDLVLSAAGLAVVAVALRRERGAVIVYSLIQIVLMTTLIIAGQPFQSLPRRIFLLFPIFTQLARWSLRLKLRRAVFLASAALMLACAAGFITFRFIP